MKKSFAKTYEAYAAAPNNYVSIEGVPPAIAIRLPGFVDFGMDGDELVKAVRKAGPEKGPATPEWADVLMEYGHKAMERGEKAEQKKDAPLAERAFLDASFWYFFARFPHVLNAGGAKAYELHIKAYLRAAKYSAHPMEIVNIAVDGKSGKAYLRLPETSKGKVPVVMVSGGVDTWKSELEVHSLSEGFLNKGMATLSIDIPGTGECPIPASESAHSWFTAALEALKQHPRVDGSKMGFYGLSFGGYWATKLAFIEPWLSGVVNNGGPVHLTFQPKWAANLPVGLQVILGLMFGLAPNSDPSVMGEKLADLSLYKQGYIPAVEQAPILHLNGEEDEVVPIEEIHFLREKGVKQDTLIFAHDRHVASRNWKLHEWFAVSWMAKKLL